MSTLLVPCLLIYVTTFSESVPLYLGYKLQSVGDKSQVRGFVMRDDEICIVPVSFVPCKSIDSHFIFGGPYPMKIVFIQGL